MIIDLLIISVTVALIWNTDFFPTVDEWVSKRVRFHHIPKPFLCSLCGCWWLSLIYIIVTGNLSLISILCCIVGAYLTNFWVALWGMIENVLFKVVEIVNKLLDYIK